MKNIKKKNTDFLEKNYSKMFKKIKIKKIIDREKDNNRIKKIYKYYA